MLHKVTFTLLVIGGLNWLLFGLAGVDIGSLLGGMDSVLAKAIYIIVGLSAVYEVAMMFTKKQGGASKPMGGQQPM